MSKILGVLLASQALSGSNMLNRDRYPAFNTDETDPEKFWDSLNHGKYHMFGKKRQYANKIEVGELAIHQGYMTAETRWACDNRKFKDLSRRQKKIIDTTLKCKDEEYRIISTRGMCGSLFRI